jgi:diguanylate cyclase (GGDEF)-like protein
MGISNAGKLWTEHLSPWVTVGLLSILLTMGLISTMMVIDVTRTAELRATSNSRLSALRQVLSLLREAESGTRAYVITGHEEYLPSYANIPNELTVRLTELRRLTLDDPQQTTYTRVLESIAREQLDQLQSTAAARRDTGFEAAARQVDSERGRRLMVALRTVAAAMEEADINMLSARITRFNMQRLHSLIALWTLTGIAFFGTSAAAWQLRRDIRRLRRQEHVLEFEATHDPLTRLQNRRRFEIELRQALAPTASGPAPFALVVADLDHFKAVNDTLGHQAGDQVLQVVAARMRDGFRDVDTLARVGGEEFAALLRGLDAAGACQVAERVRENIAAAPINLTGAHKGRMVRITISIGVAAFPDDGTTDSALFQAADGALYEAKNAGRNRVMRAAREARQADPVA